MVLNYIWIGFFIIGFVVALIRVIGYYFRDFFAEYLNIIFDKTDLEVFSAIVQSTFDMAEFSVKMSIYLIGVMALWLGIMRIGEKGGAIKGMSKLIGPLFNKLFPDIPKNHPAYGSMIMNICANMLGLDNAATPLGLKAMNDLQEVNQKKNTASNSQIMFIVLNTSGLTIIPISILAYRAAAGAANPTDIFIPILLTTFFSTIAGLIAVSIFQKINLFNKVILAYIGGASLLIALFIWSLAGLSQAKIGVITNFGGNFILFSIIILFIFLAVRKKINIYETFVDGAKEGFGVAIKIIPFLVAILVAIGVFRASGAFDFLISGIKSFFDWFGVNTDFVDALPTALMKPLSGSGARGMMLEVFQNPNLGVDSFAGKLASTFQGSTETTFYVIAVYFGAVGIKHTRHAVTCGLIADFTAIIAGIFIGYLFFK